MLMSKKIYKDILIFTYTNPNKWYFRHEKKKTTDEQKMQDLSPSVHDSTDVPALSSSQISSNGFQNSSQFVKIQPK